jgi:hemolysin-activating ACP:hemolysin acyltransferase
MLVPQIPLNVEEVINFSNEWGNPVSFELFNVLGATICKGFLNSVEQISTITNNLSNGLYLLQLTNPKGETKTLKIIINN